MKKLLIITALLISSTAVIWPQDFANAYSGGSGACSYHEGVKCSAGAHWDGSTICNDGWVDSTVKFRDVLECQIDTKLPCISPKIYGTYFEYDQCDRIQAECDRYNEAQKISCIRSGRSSEQCASYGSCENVALCRQQVKINIEAETRYDQCYQNAMNAVQVRIDESIQRNKNLDELLEHTIKEASCGVFAHYDSQQEGCFCNSGYAVNEDSSICIPIDQSCRIQFGPNTYGVGSTCTCTSGYVMNSVRTQCVLKTVIPEVVAENVAEKPTPVVEANTQSKIPTVSAEEKIVKKKSVPPIETKTQEDSKLIAVDKIIISTTTPSTLQSNQDTPPKESEGFIATIKNFFSRLRFW